MAMLKYVALLVVILNLGSLVEARVACKPSMIEECVENLKQDFLESGTSVTNLTVLCQPTFSCLERVHRSCVSRSSDNSFKEIYKGVHSLIQDICNKNSDLHKEGLKHGKCVSRIQSKLQRCQHSFKSSIQKMVSAEESDMFPILCCSYNTFMDCYENSAKDACGAEAGTYIRTIMARSTEGVLREHCASYIDGETKCNV